MTFQVHSRKWRQRRQKLAKTPSGLDSNWWAVTSVVEKMDARMRARNQWRERWIVGISGIQSNLDLCLLYDS